MLTAQVVLCCVIGYLLGNFSPAFLIGKLMGYDVRKDGSGNAGATNAFILAGKNAFFITALLDILKAFAAYTLCRLLFPGLSVAGPLGGVGCILGHIYPVLLRFRGGKGLASLGGVILAWNWRWFFLLLAAAVVIAFVTQYVCFVAPTMSVVFPACYLWRTGLLLGALILLIPAGPIFVKHWENFIRIREGTEMRMRFIWDKESELRRVGRWNATTQAQLDRRGKLPGREEARRESTEPGEE